MIRKECPEVGVKTPCEARRNGKGLLSSGGEMAEVVARSVFYGVAAKEGGKKTGVHGA